MKGTILLIVAFCFVTIKSIAADRSYRESDAEFNDFKTVTAIIADDFGGINACEYKPEDGSDKDSRVYFLCTLPAGKQFCFYDRGEHCYDAAKTNIVFSPNKFKFKKRNTKVSVRGQVWAYDRCPESPEFTSVLNYKFEKRNESWELAKRSSGITIDLRKRCSESLED